MKTATIFLLLVTGFLYAGCASINIQGAKESKEKILENNEYKKQPLHKRLLIRKALDEWAFFNYGQIKENHHYGRKRINKYWDFIVRKRPEETQWTKEKRLSDEAWSAAFISYVIGKTNKYKNFYYHPIHRTYINNIKNNKDSKFNFIDRNFEPSAADIICLSKKDGGKYHDHCEIIVSANTEELNTISGNQDNSVGKITYKLSDGKFLCEEHSDSSENEKKPYKEMRDDKGGLCVLLKNVKK